MIIKPSFISQKIYSKNLVAIHQIKPVLTLNKPIYVGFSILDLSKLLMYEFHCKYIKNKFDAKLLFTDTDSLVYEIKTEDIYEDFDEDKYLFDFSDYPLNKNFFDPVNKKVIGKMKVFSVYNKEVTKAKGVNEKIKHKEFVDVLFNRKVIRHNMKRIQSRLHKIRTYNVCKISLSCFDDKRYVLDNGISNLAYFHEDIKD